MTSNAMFEKRQPALEPVDEAVDHVRGPAVAPLILEYADCECPYSRRAFRKIELVEKEIGGGMRSRSGTSRLPRSTRTPSLRRPARNTRRILTGGAP